MQRPSTEDLRNYATHGKGGSHRNLRHVPREPSAAWKVTIKSGPKQHKISLSQAGGQTSIHFAGGKSEENSKLQNEYDGSPKIASRRKRPEAARREDARPAKEHKRTVGAGSDPNSKFRSTSPASSMKRQTGRASPDDEDCPVPSSGSNAYATGKVAKLLDAQGLRHKEVLICRCLTGPKLSNKSATAPPNQRSTVSSKFTHLVVA